ncbi:MAG: hypothetical protein R3A79_29380 [Nannocystaceae bacterium]
MLHKHAHPAHSTALALAAAVVATLAVACSPQVDPSYAGEPLATIRGAVTAQQSASSADVAVLWFTNESETCDGPSFTCDGGGGGPAEGEACVTANCGPWPEACTPEEQEPFKACVEACGWIWSFSSQFDLCVDSAAGERVSVSGEFPAAFTLDLYQPPPESALLVDADGIRVAYGWFVVADSEAETISFDIEDPTPPSSILGGTADHALIYAADPVPADSGWGGLLGGAFEPGYHVVELIPEETICQPTPFGEGTYCYTSAARYVPTAADLDTELSVAVASFDAIPWPSL